MKKSRSGNRPINGNLALTIGTFDGVHVGHQLLLDETREIAQDRGIKSAAYTYEIPPRRYLNDAGPPLIMDPEKKLDLLRNSVGQVILGDFLEVKDYSPKRYVEEILVERLKVDAVVVGKEWRFGQGRSGSYKELKELSKGRFTVHPQNQVKKRGKPVSSTWIRQVIAEGEMELAEELLGRYPSYLGKVVEGEQVGEEIGFPTANLRIDERVGLPMNGNYAAFVELNGEKLGSAVHVGNRPTFGGTRDHQMEVHLIGYEGDLYGEQLEVKIIKYLGKTRKYEKKEELTRAISGYVVEAKKVLQGLSSFTII
ncbi:MAG: riboflavin biosynthesis protein RibF [Candidatus Bipolaricaulia bacterium]